MNMIPDIFVWLLAITLVIISVKLLLRSNRGGNPWFVAAVVTGSLALYLIFWYYDLWAYLPMYHEKVVLKQ